MNRLSLGSLLLGIAFASSASHANAQTSIPVDHREPITIHIVDEADGHPIAHLHLMLVGGYDRTDLDRHLWSEDATTDAQGEIRLPSTMVNLPWLRLLMPKSNACKANPRAQTISIERIRAEGLNAPNRCGSLAFGDLPGVLTVYGRECKSAQTVRPSAAGPIAATTAQDTVNDLESKVR